MVKDNLVFVFNWDLSYVVILYNECIVVMARRSSRSALVLMGQVRIALESWS